VLLTRNGRLRMFCVKLHIIIIVLVIVIVIARMKPLLLLLPKIKARVKQKLRRIAPART
jgi:hypothetical protein